MKNLFIEILNHRWTPIAVGGIISFWALALDAWVGGFGFVLFGGLAIWKAFFQEKE